jgi:MFS family permease
LLTTATFGVGFFMRPVGGILLGIYADRRGRKAALLLWVISGNQNWPALRSAWLQSAAHHRGSVARVTE